MMSLFSGVPLDTPEILLESEVTKSGRIEYQYTIAGSIGVLSIEVKHKLGTIHEKLGHYAQVIAECIGMIVLVLGYVTDHRTPIYAAPVAPSFLESTPLQRTD